MTEVIIISELCGQFGGSIRRAEQMILQSKMGGANYAKIQLYDTYKMPGENRGKWAYLNIDRHGLKSLHDFSEKLHIGFFASVFQEDKYQMTVKEGLLINKIASSVLVNNMDLCRKIVESGNLTLCSLGKWDGDSFPFQEANLLYMHCVCEYPHIYERAIELMPERFEAPLLGYSDHSIGIEACKEAVRRGATHIEKHFTINRGLQCETEGAHICSMEYNDLVELRNFCDEYVHK